MPAPRLDRGRARGALPGGDYLPGRAFDRAGGRRLPYPAQPGRRGFLSCRPCRPSPSLLSAPASGEGRSGRSRAAALSRSGRSRDARDRGAGLRRARGPCGWPTCWRRCLTGEDKKLVGSAADGRGRHEPRWTGRRARPAQHRDQGLPRRRSTTILCRMRTSSRLVDVLGFAANPRGKNSASLIEKRSAGQGRPSSPRRGVLLVPETRRDLERGAWTG